MLPGPSFFGSPLGYAPVDTPWHSATLSKSLALRSEGTRVASEGTRVASQSLPLRALESEPASEGTSEGSEAPATRSHNVSSSECII